jgi:hypothetical protein
VNQSIWRLSKGLPIAALLGFCGAANSEDYQFALRTSAGASDNIAREAFNPKEDVIAEIGLSLAISHESRRFQIEADGDFAYQEFLQDSFDDDLSGGFNGTASLAVIPEYVSWVAVETFGQTRQDLSAGVTPENRENINIFETGPDITIPLPGANDIQVFGRYRTLDYEKTNLDSERRSGGAGLRHNLSKESSIGVNYNKEVVEYKDLGDAANFDRDSAFLRYQIFNSRNDLTVDAGVSRIQGAGGDKEGPLARVSFTHQLTTRNMLWLEASREFSDAGLSGSLLSSMPTTDLTDESLSQTSEPFTSDYVMLGWSITGRRTDLEIAASRSQEKYIESSGFNRTRAEFNADLTRALGAGWTAALQLNHERNDFESAEPDYAESIIALAFTRRMSRYFYFETAYDYARRTGDLDSTNYSENRLWLRVRYGDVVLTRFGSERSRSEWKK